MLVLSRKTRESIHIGDDVVVSILKVRGGKVEIGIEAPQDVQVLRCEIAHRENDWFSWAADGSKTKAS